ncbi:MAG: hypothetical protein AABW51_03160 [Nanoarchaeota archaeon]
MQNLVDDLYKFAGRELHEAAWVANLPIHNGVALHSFFNGFNSHGEIKVELDDRNRKASFYLPINFRKKERIFSTQISYSELLQGWKNHLRSSPKSMYDSIYQVYDNMGESIENMDKGFFRSSELDWSRRFRNSSPREIREFMEVSLLEYFGRYHEGVLLNYRDQKSSELLEPKIFWDVLKEFPLGKLHTAVVNAEVDHSFAPVGPCSEYILETPESEFDSQEYFPSESALMDVFWGMYLQKLTLKKGYPTFDIKPSLKCFITQRNNALMPLRAS